MESIVETSELLRLKRAMLVIEGLTYIRDNENTFLTIKNSGVEEVLRNFNTFVSEIYKISHCARFNTTSCYHEDWLIQIEKWEIILKELNIIDVEKYL
jgi:hypothetical protein